MADAAIAELEAAARLFMQQPNAITPAQRQAAEAIIMNFRKTKSPYSMCQQILEKSQADLLLFEAADVLRHSLITEWNDLTDSDKLSLRQYLLNYILHRNVPAFVREKILQVVAIMIKRSSLIDVGIERGFILDEMQKMITSTNRQQQLLACRIIYAIMQEYVTTVKSDDNGLTFEEHFKAKKQFESNDLKKIFLMILNAFEEQSKILDLNDSMQAHLILEFFTIQETILTWGFVSPRLPIRLIGVFESINKAEQNPALRLAWQWERIFIQDEKCLELFFHMYWKVRDVPLIQQRALTCLTQLASLNGPIMNNVDNKLKYISRFLTHFLQMIASVELKNTEAIGIAIIFQRIMIYSLPDGLSEQIRNTFLQQLFMVTCKFAECAAYEESAQIEDPVYMDALNKIFEAWCLVNQTTDYFPTEMIKQYSIQIFNKYLQCHLSAPDGLRGAMNGNNCETDTDEIDENEQDDTEKYKEQLILIGTFGREQPGHSIPILCKLIESKTQQLRLQLQQIYAGSSAGTATARKQLDCIYDDLHWILLIGGHVLSMECVGEQPLIPSEIMQYSIQQMTMGQTDIETSLKVLAAPGQCISDIPNAENVADHVIRLVAGVLRLCEMENNAIDSKMASALSPEISANIMWFLQMWSESYLLMQNVYYSNISDALKAAFGVDTPGGNWTVGFLLNKIAKNVQNFYTEKSVVDESIRLFLSMVKRKHVRPTVFGSEHFKQILELRNLDIPKMALIKGLTLAATCVGEKDAREQYLTQVLAPIRDNFTKLEWRRIVEQQQQQRNSNDSTKSIIAIRLAFLLDEMKACNLGASPDTAAQIYTYFESILIDLPDIMNCFYEYQMVVVAVLELLCEIQQNLFYLSTSHKVYEVCMNVILVYVKHNSNRRTTTTATITTNTSAAKASAEEDSMEDLLLLLKLISHVLSTNYFDFTDTPENAIDAADVCVFGLQYIIPLITMDLLKYPNLCLKYYQTITLFIETKSKKIPTLAPELLSNLLQSIELGLNSFGTDVQSTCFEFIQICANVVHENQNPEAYIYTALMPFVRICMEMVLTQKVGTDNTTDCAKALFALICCYKDFYVQIIQMILQSTAAEHVDRLTKEFTDLTANMELIYNRFTQNDFIERFNKFIINIAFMYN